MPASNEIREQTGTEIAIIGMAIRVAGASNLDDFCRNVFEGVESVSFFSDAEAANLDPKTRILHELAYHALEDAGYAGSRGSNVGVFVGASEDAEWLRRVMGQLPLESARPTFPISHLPGHAPGSKRPLS
jgi:acyl transferase domain-containing protein